MIHKWGYTNYHDLNLDWILEKIRLLESKVKEIEDLSNEWVETLNDIKRDIQTMENLYDMLLRDNNAFKDEVVNNFASLSNDIENKINQLSNQLTNDFIDYTNVLNNRISSLEYKVNFNLNSFTRQLTDMERKLDYALNNLWLNLKMINVFTGQEESVLSVIDYLCSLHMQDGITAFDYDALELTAQTYDDKQLTASAYDTQANILLRQ